MEVGLQKQFEFQKNLKFVSISTHMEARMEAYPYFRL